MFSQGRQKYIVKYRIIYYCGSMYNNWGNLCSSLTFSTGMATVKFTKLILLSRVIKFTVTSKSPPCKALQFEDMWGFQSPTCYDFQLSLVNNELSTAVNHLSPKLIVSIFSKAADGTTTSNDPSEACTSSNRELCSWDKDKMSTIMSKSSSS